MAIEASWKQSRSKEFDFPFCKMREKIFWFILVWIWLLWRSDKVKTRGQLQNWLWSCAQEQFSVVRVETQSFIRGIKQRFVWYHQHFSAAVQIITQIADLVKLWMTPPMVLGRAMAMLGNKMWFRHDKLEKRDAPEERQAQGWRPDVQDGDQLGR